jgi:membrane fusion protein (multidrug efflux system)
MNRALPTLALAALALAACGEKEEAVDTVVAKETKPLPVQVAVLEPATFDDRLELFAKVAAKQSVRITAEIPGRIESLPYDEGDKVRRGYMLAKINARIASAQLQQAEAQAELAKATYERTKKMHAKNLAASAEVEVTKAQAASAEAAVELASANLEKAVISSPITGVVSKVFAKKGEVAAPGVPLLEVVQIDEVDVVADVAERDISLLEPGAEATIETEAYPGRPFAGTIGNVGLTANGTTRTFPVEIAVDNKDGALRPGMLAKVQMTRKRLAGVVVVPRDAVLDETDGKAVYVVEGDAARRRSVVVGAVTGRYTVAREGLSVGDKLIVLGHRQAVEGQKVEITKTSKCCAEQAKPATPPPPPEEKAPAVKRRPKKAKKATAKKPLVDDAAHPG